MSEFTSGILFLERDRPALEKAASIFPQKYLLHRLNEKWGALFSENMNIRLPELSSWLRASSKVLPLFYFQHAGDHGWGYNLFRDAQEVALVDVRYEIEFHMWLNLVEVRYPQRDFVEFMTQQPELSDALKQEVLDSEAYHNAIVDQYRNKNLSKFTAFDVAHDTITELDAVVCPEQYLKDMLHHVERFKALLGITEMTWMSYRYLSGGAKE